MSTPKMMLPRILVVDDDKALLQLARNFLSARSLSVVVADTGSEALLLAKECPPDLALLDVVLPDLDGLSLCRILKQRPATRQLPVIMMSRSEIEEKSILSGFEGGADDYILKPFSFPVLAAKINALLARSQALNANNKLKKCGIEIDLDARTVTTGGRPISLTSKEFDLLSVLMSKTSRILSLQYLLETVWGYDPAVYNNPETVEVHVYRLRRKLGHSFAKHIVSVVGHGYKFEERLLLPS